MNIHSNVAYYYYYVNLVLNTFGTHRVYKMKMRSCVFEDRVKQHFVTLWRNEVLHLRKLATYSMFKTEFGPELYLYIRKIKKPREIFCIRFH